MNLDRGEMWRRIALFQSGRLGTNGGSDTGARKGFSAASIEEIINARNVAFQESSAAMPATYAALRGVVSSETVQAEARQSRHHRLR